MATCPHCGKSTLTYRWKKIDLTPGLGEQIGHKLSGIDIACPNCEKTISVAINPYFQADLTADQVKRQ